MTTGGSGAARRGCTACRLRLPATCFGAAVFFAGTAFFFADAVALASAAGRAFFVVAARAEEEATAVAAMAASRAIKTRGVLLNAFSEPDVRCNLVQAAVGCYAEIRVDSSCIEKGKGT